MSVLKQSLYALYANDYQIIDLLEQCDFSSLDSKFNSELYARMDKESCAVAKAMLESDLVQKYDYAVQSAAMACSQDLAKMIELLITPQTNKPN